ncbi:hypothetical protein JHN46_21970 [Streptomyces sp. MBT33]|nr:hypothetical protein [Streptomyces sp. MBT33]MBK3643317.1 hypothetical protein [Streptomyces sp. MBT33]
MSSRTPPPAVTTGIGLAATTSSHRQGRAGVRQLHDVGAEVRRDVRGVRQQDRVPGVGDAGAARIDHRQQRQAVACALSGDRAEVGELGGLGVRPEVDVHADAVGAQGDRLFHGAHQDLRVLVRRVLGAAVEVDDQCHPPERVGRQEPHAPLVDDDPVDLVGGHFLDESGESGSGSHRAVGQRVVERNQERRPGSRVDNSLNPAILSGPAVCIGHLSTPRPKPR